MPQGPKPRGAVSTTPLRPGGSAARLTHALGSQAARGCLNHTAQTPALRPTLRDAAAQADVRDRETRRALPSMIGKASEGNPRKLAQTNLARPHADLRSTSRPHPGLHSERQETRKDRNPRTLWRSNPVVHEGGAMERAWNAERGRRIQGEGPADKSGSGSLFRSPKRG